MEIDLKTIYIIGHLFGVAIGAGGAFISDGMYMYAIKDKKLTHTEIGFLKFGGYMVWLGLTLLVLSGALLFSLDAAKYLASSKFLVKMTVVAVIILNGLLFHFVYIPLFSRGKNQHMHLHEEFKKKSYFIYASGAVSLVSWATALILGSLRSIPLTYTAGLMVYLALVVCAIGVSAFARNKFMKK